MVPEAAAGRLPALWHSARRPPSRVKGEAVSRKRPRMQGLDYRLCFRRGHRGGVEMKLARAALAVVAGLVICAGAKAEPPALGVAPDAGASASAPDPQRTALADRYMADRPRRAPAAKRSGG